MTAVAAGGATTAADEPSADTVPPMWLQEIVTGFVKDRCSDASVSIVWCKLGVARDLKVASGEQYDASSGGSGRPMYIVVARGDFTYTTASVRPGRPVPTGRTLVLSIDPESQSMSSLGLLRDDVAAEARIGPMSSFELL